MDDPTGVWPAKHTLCYTSTSYFFTARRWFPHVFIDHTKLPCLRIISACCGCACRLEINNCRFHHRAVQESGFMKRAHCRTCYRRPTTINLFQVGATTTTFQSLGLCQIALTPASPVTGPHASTVWTSWRLSGDTFLPHVHCWRARRPPPAGWRPATKSLRTHLPQTFVLEIWIFHVPVETAGNLLLKNTVKEGRGGWWTPAGGNDTLQWACSPGMCFSSQYTS